MDKWEIKQTNTEDYSGNNKPISISLVDAEYRNAEVDIKWDGCINFWTYSNGFTVDDEHSEEKSNNSNYIHICDIDDMIAKLQELKKIAEKHFSKEDFEMNWR